MTKMTYAIEPIGVIRSPYKEKFAIPRQPNLAPAGTGEIHLLPPYNQPDTVRGLMQFSHLWLVFIFNQTQAKGWRPTVRPPRLGGNERIGVFASRSTFRPNPIGLSLVELQNIVQQKDQLIIKLGSIDLLDGTPIVDIKPYLPYSDCYPDAVAGYAQTAPKETLSVTFGQRAQQQLRQYQHDYPQLKPLIEQVIAQDPRPAYKKKNSHQQIYGIRLYDFNIRWQVEGLQAMVLIIEPI